MSETSRTGYDTEEEILEARRIVTEKQFASLATMQRFMRIGLAKAIRIMDQLERRGVVGPADGAKARDVLVRE